MGRDAVNDLAPLIATAGRRECGICWTIYDPAEGDSLGQIPANTAFEALPDHWTCPNCDAPKHKFLVLADD